MPKPFDLIRTFSSTAEPILQTGEAVKLCTNTGGMYQFHHTPLESLERDVYFGRVFTYFALNLMIYDVIGYARAEDRFIDEELQKNAEKPCTELLIAEYKPCFAPGEFATMVEQLNTVLPEGRMYCYRNAIRHVSHSLTRYQPLLALGGAYMQLKRYGEIMSTSKGDAFYAYSLMGVLQQAAYDLVFHNITAGIAYQAQCMRNNHYSGKFKISFPTSFNDILLPKIDSQLMLDSELLQYELKLLENMPKGPFLTSVIKYLDKALTCHQAETISMSNILIDLIAPMQPGGYLLLFNSKDGPAYDRLSVFNLFAQATREQASEASAESEPHIENQFG